MTSTYSPDLRLELMATGDQSGTWGTTTNTNLGTLLEQSIAGVLSVAEGDTTLTLTALNGASDQARNAVVILTGAMTAQRNVVVPTSNKLYLIKNSTTGGFGVQVKTAAGTGVVVAAGNAQWLYCDGTNVVAGTPGANSGLTFSGVSGKTFTINNSLTFAGTDSTTMTFPSTSATLPAYAVSTWTPALSFGGSTTGITYSSQVGNYYEIGGQIVIAAFSIVCTSIGALSGAARMSIPIAPANAQGATIIMSDANLASITGTLVGRYVSGGDSRVIFGQQGAAATADLSFSNFTNTSAISGVCIFAV